MIQSENLRIGNLITNSTKQVMVVCQTIVGGCKVNGSLNYYYADEVSGIYLTDKLLEVFGFKNTWWGKEEKNKGFYAIEGTPLRIGHIFQDEFFETEVNCIVVALKYVHELQNLYYYVKREDLKVNPALVVIND